MLACIKYLCHCDKLNVPTVPVQQKENSPKKKTENSPTKKYGVYKPRQRLYRTDNSLIKVT